MMEKSSSTTKENKKASWIADYEAKKAVVDARLQKLKREIEELEKTEQELFARQETEMEIVKKIESATQTATEEVEQENAEIIIQAVKEAKVPLPAPTLKKEPPRSLARKITTWVVLPFTLASALALKYYSPKEYYSMARNWLERHVAKKIVNDPEIRGLETEYEDATVKDIGGIASNLTSVSKSTYDFLGQEKIEYKFGYYMTSVFDLSDRTPPRFKLVNDRQPHPGVEGSLGVTTTFLNKFISKGELLNHLQTTEDNETIQRVSVIGYNPRTMLMRAGHLGEFDSEWLLSQTEERILDFELNSNGTVPLVYDPTIYRMVPVMSKNAHGRANMLQIGVSRDRNLKKINPLEATRFGTLEGGKVLLVCGPKQLQVNGSFADIFRVYQKLKRDYPGELVRSFLLDNGAFNLPIWDYNNKLTSNDIYEHHWRHRTGGYALVLMNDGAISPYEYKNSYEEVMHSPAKIKTGQTAENIPSIISFSTLSEQEARKALRAETSYVAEVLILRDGTRHILTTGSYATGGEIKIAVETGGKNENTVSLAELESILEYLRPIVEKYNIPLENIGGTLDEKIWQELKNLIAQKVYNLENVKLASAKGNQVLGMLVYQESYRLTRNKDFAMGKVRIALADKGVSKRNINRTVNWIEKKVA